MIYLAAPYAHAQEAVRAERAAIATKVAARLLRWGTPVFSPVTQGHTIHMTGLVDEVTHSQWLAVDKRVLARCDELWILCLPGWESSAGIQQELSLATLIGLPVKYLDPIEIERMLNS